MSQTPMQRTIQFSPQLTPPAALPVFSWKGVILNPPVQNELEDEILAKSIDLSDKPFVEVFSALYPKLNLPELARLNNALKELFPDGGELFFQLKRHYGLPRLDDETLAAILLTPKDFQRAIAEKALGESDLSVLRDFSPEKETPFLHRLTEEKLGKQDFCRALEWGGELILFGRPLTWSEVPQGQLLAQIRKSRFLVTESEDHKKKSQWEQARWPRTTKIQHVRQGDRSFFKLTSTVRNHSELEKLIEELQSTAQEIESFEVSEH